MYLGDRTNRRLEMRTANTPPPPMLGGDLKLGEFKLNSIQTEESDNLGGGGWEGTLELGAEYFRDGEAE